jgi:hypothetical protein
MTLAQQATTAQHQGFRDKVEMSMFGAASDILGETQGVTTDAIHNKRHDLGVKVVRNDKGIREVFIKCVASLVGDVADPDTITDGDIDTQVAAVWNDIAGVNEADAT